MASILRSWWPALIALPSLACGLLACSSSGDSGAGPADAGAGGVFTGFGGGGERAVALDGGPLGRVLPDGAVIDGDGVVIGSALPDGAVVDENGDPIGRTQKAPPEACVGELRAGENVPVDIYILFDQSGTMIQEDDTGTQRIDAVREAVDEFLNDPASHGFGAGIGYFGTQPLGSVSCEPSDYADPAVGMGTLPAHAAEVMTSLNGVEPLGETPTGAAIRGACTYARGWAGAHPDRAVVILLVTDGVPEAPVSEELGGCVPTLDDAVDAATTCAAGADGLSTYVLGVGPSLKNLDEIAAAGNTDAAHLVEGGDVATQVLSALNQIRGEATIPCEFVIPTPPTGESLRFDEVNAAYTDPDGETRRLVYVEGASNCTRGDGGWYYDDPSDPHTILLCDSTCDEVKAPGGQLAIELGCETLGLPR